MSDISIIDEIDDFKIFCLEGVENIEVENDTILIDFLHKLAKKFEITSMYKTCDSIESFEESISNLLYHDRDFKDYKIIYLVFQGDENQIQIDDYYYSLEEIAEFFQGKLTDKIVHFSNIKNIDLEDESFQYFLDVTGAKALSGYINPSPILSTVLDQYYFSIARETDDVVELVHLLFEKYSSMCTTLGFRLYH